MPIDPDPDGLVLELVASRGAWSPRLPQELRPAVKLIRRVLGAATRHGAGGNGVDGGEVRPLAWSDVVTSSTAVVAVTDPDARHGFFVSADVESLLGITVREFEDRPRSLLALVHPSDRRSVLTAWRDVARGGPTQVVRCHVRARNGGELWLQLGISRLSRQRLSLTLVDVTHEVAAAMELANLAGAREVEQHAAKGIIARFSHNIRTPLQAVAGFVELLQEPHGATQLPRYLEHLGGATGHVRQLLDELDRRLRHDPVDPVGPRRSHVVDLGEVARRVTGWLEPLAASRNVQLVVVPPMVRVRARADEQHVAEIVLNLLDNAVRYDHEGGRVSVRASLAGPYAVLAVRDTGPGLDHDAQTRIFQPFERLDASDHVGTGLGLSVSRELAEGMGGEITVSSEPGEGSEFRLVLPSVGRAPSSTSRST